MLVDLNEIIDKVVSKLLVLDEINHEEYSNLSQEQQEKIGYFARDFGMNHWDWPQGIGLFGLSNMMNLLSNLLH